MGFRQGAYAKVWNIEDKGNYSVGQVSISRKNKETNAYETEFQDGFVRFVGTAHNEIKGLQIPENGLSIKISSCDCTNHYDKEKNKVYENHVIFGLELSDNNNKKTNTNKTTKANQAVDEAADEDDLPF